MSGIVGIYHGNGAPIQQKLLQSLTDYLAFRGPDGRECWVDGSIGLGHTMLRTTRESLGEHQPASIDGRFWIVADARIDSRAELIAGLQRAGRIIRQNIPDSELILHAYSAWGTSCVERLRGDFSFGIWDARNKRLFCARDHFGIKPFYFASIGSLVIISNTLDCIRKHPSVSGRLNDLAICDFLLYDMIKDPGATSFADIQRLPPAHILLCNADGVSVSAYWKLPVSAPIQDYQASDCVEQFRELLDRAVADRLRTSSVGILMSGGLDSPTVAASANRILAGNGARPGVRAYTEIFESLIPHEERHYAQLVADALGIPIEFQVSDGAGLWKSLHQQNHHWPEPVHLPWSDGGLVQMCQIAVKNRVVLTGFGGDPALSCLLSVHFLRLLKKMQFGRALADATRYLAADGRFSRLYVRTRWERWFARENCAAHYPGWLNRDLEQRLGLRERWEALTGPAAPNEAVRSVAYNAMVDPMWPALFEGHDCAATGVAVEVRHPFFDLRVVQFLLALPALPWCSDKELLREIARGVLPDAVRLRRKAPLLRDPLIELLQRPESAWVDSFEAVPELDRFVERRLIPRVSGEKDVWSAWIHLRPLSLNFWLRSNATTG